MGAHVALGEAVQSTLSSDTVGALARRFQGVVDVLVALQSEQVGAAPKAEVDK